MNSILVPTDFSTCAHNATRVALELAKASGAEIHFLHAMDAAVDWVKMPQLTAGGAGMAPSGKEEMYPEIKEKLGHARQGLNELVQLAESMGVTAYKEIGYNLAHKNITEYAEAKKVNLIVLGSHGSSGIKETLIGSNAQRVVRYSACPVLTIKEDFKGWDVKNIVFAADFKEEKVNENLTLVKTFAGLLQANIHLLFVNTPNFFMETDDSISLMEEAAKKYGVEDCTVNIYNHFTREDGILSFAANNNSDMIAISNHGFTGLRRLVGNNITETLVNHAQVPILSFPIH